MGPAIARFSATGSAPGPGRPARPGEGPSRAIGHDLAASAAVVHLARALVVADGHDGLAILPAFPLAWYGAAIEVHGLPTAWGRLSYAVRWHGSRPAVLWDLEPHPGVGPVTITAPVHMAPAPSYAPPAAPAFPPPVPTSAPGTAAPVSDFAGHPGLVKSPMVGTAYRAAEPGSAPFVDIGSKVREGQTLLIVEAMKTMNQIPAPRAGTVTAILFDDAAPVEYGEPLVVIE